MGDIAMFRSSALTITLCLATVTAQAALLGRVPLTPGGTDYQAYYDTDLDITWLANANLGATERFGVTGLFYADDGGMPYTTALAWMAALNATNYFGVDYWRMPATAQPDPTCDAQWADDQRFPSQGNGYNCTGSEMGYLFYNELGGSAGSSIATVHNENYELFSNLEPTYGYEAYWSDTPYAPSMVPPSTQQVQWIFRFVDGLQSADKRSWPRFYFVWPVAPGDPLLNVVPIPPAVWLFGSALGVLGWLRRKSVA